MIIENAETFSSLISYLVPGSKNGTMKNAQTTEPSDAPEVLKGEVMPPEPISMSMGNRMTLDQLNVPGADQLRALIMEDMAKEEAAHKAVQEEKPAPNVVHI